MTNLVLRKFSEIDLSDPFFDSLKNDYAEFSEWFARKSTDSAYVFYGDNTTIEGFLYLKEETEELRDIDPPLPRAARLKIGTFKINPHGTRLGERFLKKIFDHAIAGSIEELYVTVFSKHAALVSLFEKYGFATKGRKLTENGEELVLVKSMAEKSDSVLHRYPLISVGGTNVYLLSLYPQWHSRLLPDSILKTEDASIVQDVSHTNSIHKVYLAAMRGMELLRAGDIILIYRTSDGAGPAHYRSVATSICVIEEYRNINSFSSLREFKQYCEPYSVFTNQELDQFWTTRKYPHVLRFTYNLALPRRVTRGKMIEEMGFEADGYWGFMQISDTQLHSIFTAGQANESLIID